MNVALLMHGIIGSKQDKGTARRKTDFIDLASCARKQKKKIQSNSKFNMDVFCHSWTMLCKDEILDSYKPVNSIIEEQDLFGYKLNPAKREPSEFRAKSKWTSLKKVKDLMVQYEKENNIKYDWVIGSRYDVWIYNILLLDELDNQRFYLSTSSKLSKIIRDNKYKHKVLHYYHDIFFASSSDNMKEFIDTSYNICFSGSKKLRRKGNEIANHRVTSEALRSMFGEDGADKIGIIYKPKIDIYRNRRIRK